MANFFDNSERKDLAHVTIMDTPEARLCICNEQRASNCIFVAVPSVNSLHVGGQFSGPLIAS